MLQIAFSSTDPRCHGNEIWTKLAITRFVKEISRDFCVYMGVFGECCQSSFTPNDPRYNKKR